MKSKLTKLKLKDSIIIGGMLGLTWTCVRLARFFMLEDLVNHGELTNFPMFYSCRSGFPMQTMPFAPQPHALDGRNVILKHKYDDILKDKLADIGNQTFNRVRDGSETDFFQFQAEQEKNMKRYIQRMAKDIIAKESENSGISWGQNASFLDAVEKLEHQSKYQYKEGLYSELRSLVRKLEWKRFKLVN